jgi:uracil-DNA glycosylase
MHLPYCFDRNHLLSFFVMKPTSRQSELLQELKNYLLFLKDYGYTEIPQQIELNVAATKKPAKTSTTNRQPSPKNPVVQPPSQAVGGPLETVRAELGDCTRCKLSEGRNHIVFGSGNPNADLVFVGEGPGKDEDEQGFPFVGRAGKKLTEIIEKGMNLNRERDTYICNIVKCRPPGNRDPEKDEIEACKPFLLKQLQAIQPKVIVALGKPAASTLLGRTVPITKERGTWHEFEGFKLMLTFHPAYLLRSYTLENRKAMHDDMKKVLKALGK